jgi:hypothetical protein
LYVGLEKIERRECNKNTLEDIKVEFETFFTGCLSHKKIQQMFDEKILQVYIKDEHRNPFCLIITSESKINGDTLLLRAMSINVEKDTDEEKILNEVIDVLVDGCQNDY